MDNSVPKPSVGRVVHYVSYGTPNGEYKPEHRAAIVTAVNEKSFDDELQRIEVSLCVLNPTGLFFNEKVVYDSEFSGGSWHWPERV